MKTVILTFILLLAFTPGVNALTNGVDAGSTVSYNHATFQTCFPNIPLIISAGCANWYVDSPMLMATGRTGVNTSPTSCMAYTGYNNCYHISVTVVLDISPLVSVTIATGAGSSTGCHSQGGAAPPGTTVGFTISRTFYIGVDEGSIYCRGTLTLVLQTTTGATGIAQVLSQYEFVVPYQMNQNILCNAMEFSTDVPHPDDSSIVYPKRNPCTTPDINIPDVAAEIDQLRVDLCDNPSGHGHCSIDIHGGIDIAQDGVWEMTICPEESPCFVMSNGTVTVVGNVTTNIGNVTVGQGGDGEWDGSLYILICIMIIAMAHLGESRRDNVYRFFAGFLSLMAAFILFYELDRVGFNNIGEQGLLLGCIFMTLHLVLAVYLFFPKPQENETK